MSSTIGFYQQAIQRQIKQLRILKERQGWGPSAKVKLELELAQAFHIVRKLCRGHLELDLVYLEFPTRAYAAKPGKGAAAPGKSLNPHYVMKDPEAICELFADNAVFDIVQAPDRRLGAVLVASNASKTSQLFEITILDVLELLEEVGGDDSRTCREMGFQTVDTRATNNSRLEKQPSKPTDAEADVPPT